MKLWSSQVTLSSTMNWHIDNLEDVKNTSNKRDRRKRTLKERGEKVWEYLS